MGKAFLCLPLAILECLIGPSGVFLWAETETDQPCKPFETLESALSLASSAESALLTAAPGSATFTLPTSN